MHNTTYVVISWTWRTPGYTISCIYQLVCTYILLLHTYYYRTRLCIVYIPLVVNTHASISSIVIISTYDNCMGSHAIYKHTSRSLEYIILYSSCTQYVYFQNIRARMFDLLSGRGNVQYQLVHHVCIVANYVCILYERMHSNA